MLVVMIAMLSVTVPIVEVIHMVTVLHRLVATIGAVLVFGDGVLSNLMLIVCHGDPFGYTVLRRAVR